MSEYFDKLPIAPFASSVRGSIVLPGSKSITNRALILAALSTKTVTLRGALFSRDSRIMIAALRNLGFEIGVDEAALTIRVEGRGGTIPAREAKIDVGNAGTAARFLTAFVCLRADGIYHFDGDEAMRSRPIGALLEALQTQGASADSNSFPFTLRTAGLPGGSVELDASESSQMLSALLMVATFATKPLTVHIRGELRWPFVQMTINMLHRFGLDALPMRTERGIVIPNKGAYNLPADEFRIESDASAASYFVALPIATNAEVEVSDYHFHLPLQGDVRFGEVLQQNGLIKGLNIVPAWPNHIISRGPLRNGISQNFSSFSDTFLTLAALAPLLDGPTRIAGIAHTRKQETDRVAGMARELTKLGQHVIETEDALEIHPRPLVSGVEIETYHDHRFAMSFGVLGCHDLHGNGQPWLTIKDPACCAKTFPAFFDLLAALRTASH